MTIEIKQLIIKTTVMNERQSQNNNEHIAIDIQKIKELVQQECRELIAAQLDEMRER